MKLQFFFVNNFLSSVFIVLKTLPIGGPVPLLIDLSIMQKVLTLLILIKKQPKYLWRWSWWRRQLNLPMSTTKRIF